MGATPIPKEARPLAPEARLGLDILPAARGILLVAFPMLVGHRLLTQSEILSGQPIVEITNAMPALRAISIACVTVLALVEMADRRLHIPRELGRKLAHVGGGLALAQAPGQVDSHWPMLFLAVTFTVVLLLSRRLGVLVALHSGGQRSLGTIVYPVGLYLAFLVGAGQPALIRASVLILALADALAALVGQRWGKHVYHVGDHVRSVEGSLAFALASLTIVILTVDTGSMVYAIIVVAGVTMVEALSPRGLDNLFLPGAAVLLLLGAGVGSA